ncbi:MAG TPA: T9SS type A sorting domain-containing protein [Chitinophagaceae bacterium]|jgi:hypothetical protein
MKKNCILLSLSFLAASVVSAQRLFTEDFNYSAGQLTTMSSGVWKHFSGTTEPIQVVTGNLTYPGYITSPSATSGLVLLDSAKTNAEDVNTSFTTVDSGSIYCTFLLNVLNANNLFADSSNKGEAFISFLPLSSNSSEAVGVVIKRTPGGGGSFKLGVFSRINVTPQSVVWYDSGFAANSTLLITLGYQFVAGDGNNIVMLWVNPAIDSIQPSPNAQVVDLDSASNPRKFGKLGLLQRSQRSPQCEIDAIKVSTSWVDAVLPLRLLSFNVIDNNGYASLSWQTCNEINMNRFEVQKSLDARNFAAIGEVAAKNQSCGTTYTYNDAKTLNGTAYYRIRMIDNDGTSNYSGIVSINGKVPTKISVFPNPVVNYLVVAHPKAEAGATIQIVSTNGSVIASYPVQKDAIQTSVDVSKLSKGSYIVVFSNSRQKQTMKIIK